MSRTDDFDQGRAGLNDTDRSVIDFERQNPGRGQGGAKQKAIRETFGQSDVSYYQHLNRLTNHPEAHKYDAQTMKRVQRVAAGKQPPRGPQAWGM
jgi:hypothetical protein